MKKAKVNEEEHLPAIPDNIKDDFRRLLCIPSIGNNEFMMHHYIITWLDANGISWKYDKSGNILAIKGTTVYYPCIVAHTDTVHQIVDEIVVWRKVDKSGNDIYFAKEGHEDNSPKTGIGGDDKCGIYAVMHMLKTFKNIKAVFFTREEKGCVGSSGIDLSFFADVGYIMQLDRFGRSDFICENTETSFISQKFDTLSAPVLAKYGYSHAKGLTTDVVKLFQREVGVSCVNISCGYYQHHTEKEYINLNEFYNSLLFTKSLISALGEDIYMKKPDERIDYRKSYPSYQDNDHYYGRNYREDNWHYGQQYDANLGMWIPKPYSSPYRQSRIGFAGSDNEDTGLSGSSSLSEAPTFQSDLPVKKNLYPDRIKDQYNALPISQNFMAKEGTMYDMVDIVILIYCFQTLGWNFNMTQQEYETKSEKEQNELDKIYKDYSGGNELIYSPIKNDIL